MPPAWASVEGGARQSFSAAQQAVLRSIADLPARARTVLSGVPELVGAQGLGAARERAPMVDALPWAEHLDRMSTRKRVRLAREFLEAAALAERVGLFGFEAEPVLSEKGAFVLGRIDDAYHVRVRVPLLGPFQNTPRDDRAGTAAWAVKYAAAIAGEEAFTEPLPDGDEELEHPFSPAAALESTLMALTEDHLSLARADTVYRALTRGEGRALFEVVRNGVSLDGAAKIFQHVHQVRSRDAELRPTSRAPEATRGARTGLRVRGPAGSSAGVSERHISAGLKRGRDLESERSAVILDDGSAVVNTGEMLGHGSFRHAKRALFIREEEGRVSVQEVCKLSGHQATHRIPFRDRRTQKTYHLKPTYARDRERELEVQQALAEAGAEYVLLPIAAYDRPKTNAEPRHTQILPLADQDLSAAIAARTGLAPEARFGELLPWLTSAARGIAEMHALKLRHNDIKPANIAITGDRARLADLGLASSAHAQDTGGSPLYMPPAFAARRKSERPIRTPALDVFALGVTLLEAWHGSLDAVDGAGHGISDPRTREASVWGALYSLAGQVSSTPVRDLISSLIRPDEAQRPTAAQAVAALEALSTTRSGARAPKRSRVAPGPPRASA